MKIENHTTFPLPTRGPTYPRGAPNAALSVQFLPIAERIDLSGPAKGILATRNPVMKSCPQLLGTSPCDDARLAFLAGRPRRHSVNLPNREAVMGKSGPKWVGTRDATHQRLKLDP